MWNRKNISDLVGRVAVAVSSDDYDLVFDLDSGETVRFYHEQDCCESVYIEDINGDLQDLVGTPILVAEQRDSDDLEPLSKYDEAYQWTFYTFRTIKGSVDVRFYGTSNGYYSMGVSCIWK